MLNNLLNLPRLVSQEPVQSSLGVLGGMVPGPMWILKSMEAQAPYILGWPKVLYVFSIPCA